MTSKDKPAADSMVSVETLDSLKRRFAILAPGESVRLRAAEYIKLIDGGQTNVWDGSRALGNECGCRIEFWPDGVVWVIKKP